MEKIWIAKKH